MTGIATKHASSISVGFFGEVLADVLVRRTVRRNLGICPAAEVRLGGAAINAAAVAAQLSSQIHSYPICVVGSDWLGDFLVGRLKAFGTQLDCVQRDRSHTTSAALYPIADDGEQLWSEYHRSADLWARVHGPMDAVISGLDGVGFGATSLSRARSARGLESVLALLPSKSIVAFDLNYRSAMWTSTKAYVRATAPWIERAALIKANLREAQLVTGIEDPELAIQQLPATKDQVIFVTLGHAGCLLRRGTFTARLSAKRVDGDPVGAGDAFFAGALCGVLFVRRDRQGSSLTRRDLVNIGGLANDCGRTANEYRGPNSTGATSSFRAIFAMAVS